MIELPRILLCDINPAVCQAWRKIFVDEPEVEVIEGSIVDVTADAVVSPANSFGFMDGGVYTDFFGPIVQERVQTLIRAEFDGELLVGQAVMVETDHQRIPHLIAAPTMRIPQQIYDPADVYLATRAALRCAVENGIRVVAFPGMGTGCGMIHGVPAAWCMHSAFHDVREPLAFPGSISEARHWHYKLPMPSIGGGR